MPDFLIRKATGNDLSAIETFVPPVAGMILAGQVVRELAGLAG